MGKFAAAGRVSQLGVLASVRKCRGEERRYRTVCYARFLAAVALANSSLDIILSQASPLAHSQRIPTRVFTRLSFFSSGKGDASHARASMRRMLIRSRELDSGIGRAILGFGVPFSQSFACIPDAPPGTQARIVRSWPPVVIRCRRECV